jgi:cellulose synthase/poly-beta-1,6-N-acetylglucosamine synthase-like glycosyltransferase
MTFILFFFLINSIIIAYIYIVYPIFIFSIGVLKNNGIMKNKFLPNVTILIAAYNEANKLPATLENKLNLRYPKDKYEVIVISDGSTDGTDEVVSRYDKMGIRLIHQEPRKGKTSALNMAVPQANGEILVFSDSNSMYDKNSLRYLMENFADSRVGYVTGKMVYINHDGTMIGDGCSTYMKYENLLRAFETRVGSIVGVDGGIDAVRKSLYRPMRDDQLPDFVLPLMAVEQGYRVVYEPRALLNEETLKSTEDEYQMRVRVSLRALWALWDMRGLLNPGKYGVFSFQLLSHKVLRYLSILFMIGSYIGNTLILPRGMIYLAMFILQTIFYGAALAGHFVEKRGKLSRILYIPYYFCLINIAAGHALIKFFRGEKQILWTPRKG